MINHSFAVLAYKDSPYLPACLESLINQTVASKIYISTSTPSVYISEIAKEHSIEVFVTESGRGVTHDDNFGLQNAKTKYVTLAHQDDLYLPNYTESCLKAAEKYQDILICFTNYSEIFDGKDRPVTLMLKVKRLMILFFMPFKSSIKSKFWKMKLLSLGNPISLPTVMYNLEKMPGFQFPLELSTKPNTMDWITWCQMAKMEGRFAYVKRVVQKRRIHADSLTSFGLGNNSRYIEDLEMFERFWPPLIAKILTKFYALSYKSNKIQ